MSPRHPALAALALLLGLATPACTQSQGAPERARTPAPSTAQRDSLAQRADRARSKGADSARVTIYEISDFQCPYCARFAQQTFARLDSAYIRTGKVRLVFINFPIPSHRDAWAASEAALCAGAQDAFWPMHNLLFARQAEWSQGGLGMPRLLEYAAALQLDAPAFRSCVESDAVASVLVNDIMQTSRSGIGGTPTFILNGQKAISGAEPFETFQKEIEALLAQ